MSDISDELFTNVIELGEYARERLMQDIIAGRAGPDAMNELREMEENIKILKAERARRQ